MRQIEAANPRKGWDVVTVSQGYCLPTLLGTGVTSPVAGVLGSPLTSAGQDAQGISVHLQGISSQVRPPAPEDLLSSPCTSGLPWWLRW